MIAKQQVWLSFHRYDYIQAKKGVDMERLALGPGGCCQHQHVVVIMIIYTNIMIMISRQGVQAPPKEADGEQVCQGGQG